MFSGLEDPQFIQGIYLQPDPPRPKLNPLFFKTLNGNNNPQSMPDIVQRLARRLDVSAKELTLTQENGERLAFWCSNMVRHTMAPDNSSITFSGTNELDGQWLVCTTIFLGTRLDMGFTRRPELLPWNARKQGREAGNIDAKPWQVIGSLDLQRIAVSGDSASG